MEDSFKKTGNAAMTAVNALNDLKQAIHMPLKKYVFAGLFHSKTLKKQYLIVETASPGTGTTATAGAQTGGKLHDTAYTTKSAPSGSTFHESSYPR